MIAVDDGVLEVGAHFTLSTGGVDAEGKLLRAGTCTRGEPAWEGDEV